METVVIQVDLLQTVLALGVFVATMGVAWGSVQTSIRHLQDSVDKLISESKEAKEERSDIRERVARIEATPSAS